MLLEEFFPCYRCETSRQTDHLVVKRLALIIDTWWSYKCFANLITSFTRQNDDDDDDEYPYYFSVIGIGIGQPWRAVIGG